MGRQSSNDVGVICGSFLEILLLDRGIFDVLVNLLKISENLEIPQNFSEILKIFSRLNRFCEFSQDMVDFPGMLWISRKILKKYLIT